MTTATTTEPRPLYQSDTETRTVTRRLIGHCRRCGFGAREVLKIEKTTTTTYGLTGMKVRRFERVIEGDDSAHFCRCATPRPLTMRAVIGTVTDTPCDERCTSATGHKCECACGGKNHGSNL